MPVALYCRVQISFAALLFEVLSHSKKLWVENLGDMEVIIGLIEAFNFICTFQFWRMTILWTLSLIFSYIKLLIETNVLRKSKRYPRATAKELSSNITERPVCIITGASSGLGAAAAYDLSKEGFYVVIADLSHDLSMKVISDIKSRNSDACLKAFEVDVSSLKSILSFKEALQRWLIYSNMHSSVQLLINNAGILATSHRFTPEGYDQMMATNYLGAFCLTKVLLPLLDNSPIPSRVVNVSSFTHRNVSYRRVDRDAVSGKCFAKSKYYPYAHTYEYSKFCLILFSYELNRQLGLTKKSRHISVVVADPGAVKTNIMREIPSYVSQFAFKAMIVLGILQSPEIGVGSIVDAALAPTEVSGVYFFGGNGRSLASSSLSYNSKLGNDLWANSCSLFEDMQMALGPTSSCT